MKNFHIAYITFFAILLFGPISAKLFSYESSYPGIYNKLRNNQKVKYQPIQFSMEGIADFSENLEHWYEDNFGFRNELVKMNVLLYRCLGASHNRHQFIFGENGFIFKGDMSENALSISLGIDTFEYDETRRYFEKLAKINEFFKIKEIPVYFAIAPNKHSIYPEYLPAYYQKISKTKYDQLIQYNNDSLNIIDLRDTLITEKENYGDLLYFKTDSHWSELGRYLAYRKIMNRIKQDFTSVEILEMKGITVHEDRIGGDLAYNANLLGNVHDDSIHLIYNRTPDTIIRIDRQGNQRIVESEYEVGLNEHVVIENNNKEGCLLFIRDSFGRTMSSFHQSFGKVIHLYSLSGEAKEVHAVLDEYQPDLVLFEFVERYLNRSVIEPEYWFDVEDYSHAETIVNLKGSEILECTERIRDFDAVKIDDEAIQFRANHKSGTWFFLKDFDLPDARYYYMSVRILVPENTVSILFYSTETNNSYNRNNSVKNLLTKGWNNVIFKIPGDGVTGRFRFDPGYAVGKYTIENIDFKYAN